MCVCVCVCAGLLQGSYHQHGIYVYMLFFKVRKKHILGSVNKMVQKDMWQLAEVKENWKITDDEDYDKNCFSFCVFEGMMMMTRAIMTSCVEIV